MADEAELTADGGADMNDTSGGLGTDALLPADPAPAEGGVTSAGATSSTQPELDALKQSAQECVDCLMACYDLIQDDLEEGIRECDARCGEACRAVIGQLELSADEISTPIVKANDSITKQMSAQLNSLNAALYDAESQFGIEYTGAATLEQPMPECPAGTVPAQQPDGSWRCIPVGIADTRPTCPPGTLATLNPDGSWQCLPVTPGLQQDPDGQPSPPGTQPQCPPGTELIYLPDGQPFCNLVLTPAPGTKPNPNPNPQCPAGYGLDPQGNCVPINQAPAVCPDGYVLDSQGQCVPASQPGECPEPPECPEADDAKAVCCPDTSFLESITFNPGDYQIEQLLQEASTPGQPKQ